MTMPVRDRYHDQVRHALIKDGWTITHDPLRLQWGVKDMYVDLGAEQLLAAEKGSIKIAVEIKSFVGLSEMDDLEKAIGQFVVYHDVLSNVEPDRLLYLAINEETFVDLFEEPIGKLLIANGRVRLLVFDPQQEVIRQWTPIAPIAS
jgi:XisH protein